MINIKKLKQAFKNAILKSSEQFGAETGLNLTDAFYYGLYFNDYQNAIMDDDSKQKLIGFTKKYDCQFHDLVKIYHQVIDELEPA